MSFTVNTATVDPDVNVITDEDGNVTRIENLPVFDDLADATIIYNVDFVYGAATEVYGGNLEFDFPFPEQEETIFLALAAVNDALNAEDSTPQGAGEQGTDDFFIGYWDPFSFTIAVGGENFDGFWSLCTTECINIDELQTGLGVIGPFDSVTWADFTEVD
jgi:hypothetical protein